MPLLVVAILTHIIYKAISNGLDWTGEASRKAWGASMAHSRSMADRMRQRMADTLDSWDQDPRGRRYAATGVRMALGLGRFLGKAGVLTALGAAKGAGAVSRALAGGALATGGLLGALAGSTRWGARAGSEWWRNHRSSSGWKLADWFPEWAERLAEKAGNWGTTVPGTATPNPNAEQPTPPPGGQAPPPPPPPPPAGEGASSTVHEEENREPKVVVVGWGDPINEKAGDSTIPQPTPVGSRPAGTSVPAVTSKPSKVIEGEVVMPTDLVPANGGVAPLATAADGMKYDQAVAYLAEQESRIRQVGQLADQIHKLQLELVAAAQRLGADHSTAEAALKQFGVSPVRMTEVVHLLLEVASPSRPEKMVEAFMALDVAASAVRTDATDLQARFGARREVVASVQAENVDVQFLTN